MMTYGEGKQVTASDTTAIWTPSEAKANNLSCYVVGAEPVYVLANCTIAEFDVMYAAGKAIRVSSGMSFNFNGDQYVNIKCVCYRTASSTSAVDFAAF
jgi:hypothetical protein